MRDLLSQPDRNPEEQIKGVGEDEGTQEVKEQLSQEERGVRKEDKKP